MRFTWIASVTWFVAQQLVAQTYLPLHGQIVDDNGLPIPLARISLIGIGTTNSTNTGNFSFNVSPDKIGTSMTVQVLKSGWKTRKTGSLSFIVPRDSTANPIRIVMVSARSPRPELTITPPAGYLSTIVRVDGVVARVLTNPGAQLARGTAVAVIDPREYLQAMSTARVDVARYQKLVLDAEAKVTAAQTAATADPAKQAELELAKGERDSFDLLLQERVATLHTAELAVAATRVVAPGCGTVKMVLIHPGDMVHRGDNILQIDRRRGCIARSTLMSEAATR